MNQTNKPAATFRPSCGNCNYFAPHPEKKNLGECRYDPPREPDPGEHATSRPIAVFPLVEPSLCCGRHPILRFDVESKFQRALAVELAKLQDEIDQATSIVQPRGLKL